VGPEFGRFRSPRNRATGLTQDGVRGCPLRECWTIGTGSNADLCRAFGWEVESHAFKVAMAADLVALWHNGRITVDRGQKEVSAAAHARSVAAS
jgi:hypothetical protein